MGYMEIRNNHGFIAVCYCDHEAEVESEAEASIDTQPEASIDEKSKAEIDEECWGENTQVLNSSRPQAGQRPLDPRWKGPQFSGSPLGGNPVPRYEVLWVQSPGPPPSPGKRKIFDKENLPYFRIWMSLTYSN
ncbi:hypothetical protein F2Q70_00017378 [Brassica cretica]|uniref:Uncharacterized protein n=1 Tax=Brassica cretica TaxID=69181 RepID=A0A8S9HVS4_BRACR|nr:hypothetical protein F2Q70_00017378 [Brassica cretica]